MSLTKEVLRNYINGKFSAKQVEIRREFETMVDEIINPMIEPLFEDSKPIEKAAKEFVRKYEKLLITHGLDTDWTHTEPIRRINQTIISFGEGRCEKLKTQIKNSIRHPELYNTNYLDKYSDELKNIVIGLQSSAKGILKRLEDLSTLQKEVEAVIKNESSAKKAHKALIALGIDMSDMEEKLPVAQLPAIQKFSVDTCVLNGGCK